MDTKACWDEAARGFHGQPRHTPRAVVYGPWCADEADLQLLAPLSGQPALDLGCGGGENAVALARQGARVTAWDISPRQLARTEALAAATGVELNLRCADMDETMHWREHGYALILATYVLPYSRNLAALLTACWDALAPGGMLVASMDHPLRACFWDDAAGELAAYPLRDYHDARPLMWRINGISVLYRHWTVGEWVAAMMAAGLAIMRVVEPQPPADVAAECWPADSALAPLAHIPHTLILAAQRPELP